MSLSSLYNITPVTPPENISELQKQYQNTATQEEKVLYETGLSSLYGFVTPVAKPQNYTIHYNDKKIKKEKKPSYIYPKYSKNYAK